jgi:hypothetical protein
VIARQLVAGCRLGEPLHAFTHIAPVPGAAILFLEQNVFEPKGNRIDRYDAAAGKRSCSVPWVIVDSGWRYSCGQVDFVTEYRQMVDEALTRPAEAEITGHYVRAGNNVRVHVRVTNRSGRALTFDEWPTVGAIVYERTRVIYTSRFVRAATQQEFPADLVDGASLEMDLIVAAVPVEDWTRAHVIVIVDSRPDTAAERYVSLQAAELRDLAAPTPTPRPLPTFPPGSPRIHLPVAVRD